MNARLRRFAPIGFYLAVVAALASAGYYIVYRQFNLILQIGIGLVVVGLAIFAILDPERVRQSITGRQARYGSNALVMILAFLGILVVVNFLINKYPQRWDLTEDKQHTLSSETIQTLQTLSNKVEAVAFFSSSSYYKSQAETLLQDYKYNSKGKFDYQFIDPVSEPVKAQNANVTQDSTIVLQMDGRQEQVTSFTEQDLTSGLIKVANPNPRTVYFLTGHGEHDPSGSGQTSYAQAKQSLSNKGYTVKSLNLLTDPQIPSDALAIIIAGPTKPVSQDEVNKLKDYVAKGGSLVVMEEPLPMTKFGEEADPLAEYLSQSWNITLGADMVIDPSSSSPAVAIAAQYGSSTITDKLRGVVSVFPTARSIETKTDSSGSETITSLVKTTSDAWGETNFTDLNNNKAQYDQTQDAAGPITVAATAENTTQKSRVVVIGDSDFASDSYFSMYGNGDLFINSVDWAAQQENLISLTPKSSTERVMVSPQKYVMNLIMFGSIFVLPGSILLSGIIVWANRRRRG